jgi:hypothetical protein
MEKNGSILEKLNTSSEAYAAMVPLTIHAQLLGVLQDAYAIGS